jgi:hypothetical protein
LAFPSNAKLMKLIQQGRIINCSVTAHDVERATLIYGPSHAELKGKQKQLKPLRVRVEPVPRLIQSRQVLHVDIMFIENDPYLVSVSTPLGQLMVSDLNSRTKAALKDGLFKHVSKYKARSFSIASLLTDREGGIMALNDEIEGWGIVINPAAAGEHVPVIENKIRQLKERVRAVLWSLPYALPYSLLKYAVFYCVVRMNWMPSGVRVDSTSPSEWFYGRKLDMESDLRIGFGQYAQVHVAKTDNTLKARTEGAIALQPMNNLQGSVKFYNLNTRSTVVRDRWTVLPIPNEVLNFWRRWLLQKRKRFRANHNSFWDSSVD